jgi:selenide,water dikinase
MSAPLTSWTTCGGCAAKWPGGLLQGLLSSLPGFDDESLLVGLSPFDDAAVYKLSDDVALVSTTDFFPPLVDDPSDFGSIAAANACSDVFAMGGKVKIALNIAAFPESFPTDAIRQIFSAAAATVAQAGGNVAGGHTIRAAEPVFGLAVQGVVHPGRVWAKGGVRPGDQLMLSKPLGTGIVLSGGGPDERAAAVAGMRQLNRAAAQQLHDVEATGEVHAVTDVTGFGLAGHCWEMASQSGLRLCVDIGRLPLYPGAHRLATAGIRTGGHDRNRAYLAEALRARCGPVGEALSLDPQTSGGLLAAVGEDGARYLCRHGWHCIGQAAAGDPAVELDDPAT